jgi:regulator of protease activity HflC (stomatin/prohibitin superfamily)
MKDFAITTSVLAVALALCVGVLGLGIMGWQQVRVYVAEYTVKTEQLTGEAEYVRAEQNRRILVEQARAEKDAAVLRAEAIEIVGQAAKDFPEYRLQEFLGAFGEALQSDNIDKIVFIPTEANIPVTEAGRTVE